MKTLRHRGFTLPELLMGIVLMSIIIGSVVMIAKTGFKLYTKTEAKSLVLEGVRFTADSYRRKIIPILENASSIELLDGTATIPATISADNHYIYLSGGKVKHKSVSGDIALEGSDYITTLDFLLPISSEDKGTNYTNYILKMSVGGRNENYDATAKLDLTVNSSLYNKPLKSGTKVDSNYSGKILRFVAKETPFEIPKGGKLWDKWTQNLQPGGTEPNSFFKTSVPNTVITPQKDAVTGKPTLTITMNSKNKQPARSVTIAKMDGTLLEDEKIATVGLEDNKSYTTLTNYSLIVDAELNSGDGYGLLLSGTTIDTGATAFRDCGYMFQYDRTIDAFPMRLFAKGEHSSNAETNHYGMALQYEAAGDSLINKISGVGGTSKTPNFGPFYGPGHMKNSIFKYVTATDHRNRPDQVPWTSRHRFVITVLEYYLNAEGKTNPRFIMRMRLLKDFDPNNSDPWQIDKNSFYSEPIWFGGFLGGTEELKYQKQTRTGSWWLIFWTWDDWSPWQYISKSEYDSIPPNTSTFQTNKKILCQHSVKNYSLYSGNSVEIAVATSNNAYTAKMPWGGQDGNSTSDFLVFNSEEMNVKNDINNSSFESNESSVSNANKTSIVAKFNNPLRERYIGLRVWGPNKEITEVKFYSVNFAPGFRKSELLAIMPQGARMYELNDTGETKILGQAQENLNEGLFGSAAGFSAGNGNGSGYFGVMGIQHVMGNCTCPMCTYPIYSGN